ncbi:mercury resistance system periplasmic binding protein MerP [Methylocaldum sp.]|uniref:mercury resistance system periplasmic binding protein MerP n=1 Tax=Methylocaldum sp. TaxID=1969727 RepID=UPI002D5AFD3B|nr:mercury resistance system periplasmic binding protein MerP [Methylocaldum sp.]HYE36933.1 mercury resistance system periplasmic binding protein MerP [Methylocaldum sp.]
MKTFVSFILLFSLVAGTALAAPRIATLEVQNMTCPVCPITVKKVLERVTGVQQVSIDYEHKRATVHFDDAATSADTLTEATKAAGYPSTLKEIAP